MIFIDIVSVGKVLLLQAYTVPGNVQVQRVLVEVESYQSQHKFIIWTIWPGGAQDGLDGKFHAAHGHYFQDLEAAERVFSEQRLASGVRA